MAHVKIWVHFVWISLLTQVFQSRNTHQITLIPMIIILISTGKPDLSQVPNCPLFRRARLPVYAKAVGWQGLRRVSTRILFSCLKIPIEIGGNSNYEY